MDYVDGKLVVDELIIDPSMPAHVVVRIGADFYRVSHAVTHSTKPLEEKDLQPYFKKVVGSWYRPEPGYSYMMYKLIPRGGYAVELGRPITDAEFTAVCNEYGLGEDDISDVFEDSKGGIFGPDYRKTFLVKQIQLPKNLDALAVESKLRNKGIEVLNGSPGRVNIRVQPGK